MTKIWQDHDHLLPNAPGKISGVIAFDDTPGRKTMTVQCAACLRTVTDMPILAANEISYARGYEIPGSGCMWSESGTLPYRRCRDCRVAGRHPEGAP